MALETGDFIADLVPANPPGTDNLNQADDHMRLIKKCLQQSFPNIDEAVTATPDQLNNLAQSAPNLFPAGNWAEDDGSSAEIPARITNYGKNIAVEYDPNMVAWFGARLNPKIHNHQSNDWRISVRGVMSGISGGNVKFRADVYMFPDGGNRSLDVPTTSIAGADFAVPTSADAEFAYPNFTISAGQEFTEDVDLAIAIVRVDADAAEAVDKVMLLEGELTEVIP